MIAGAFDASKAMIAVSLGMSVSLTFTTLWDVSLCSRRFEFYFGVV